MRKDNDKKERKRRNGKGIARRCLAVLLALLLTAQGTAFTSVYAADDTKTEEQKKEEEKTQDAAQKAANGTEDVKGADDLEYVFPESIQVKGENETLTYWDICGGSADKAVTANSRKTKDEKELVKDMLTNAPIEKNPDGIGTTKHTDYVLIDFWSDVAYRVLGQKYNGQEMYIPTDTKNIKEDNPEKIDYKCSFGPSSHGSTIENYLSNKATKKDNPYYFDMPHHLKVGVSKDVKGAKTDGVYYGRFGSLYALPQNADETNAWATGLQMGNSLADAGEAMYDVVTTYLSPTLKSSDLKKYSKIDLLTNKSNQVVAYSFVGSSDKKNSSRFDYNCFGLVFYDFELLPIVETDKDDYGENLIYTTETLDMLDALNKSTAVHNTPGIDYTPVSNGKSNFDTTTFDNSEMGSSLSTAVNYTNSNAESTTRSDSQTNNSSTTSNQSGTFTYTHTRQKGGKLSGTRTNAFAAAATLGFSETWGEAYTKGQSSTGSDTVAKGSSANATVNPYSILSVAQNVESSSLTIQYQQPCVISYKVAMVSICGSYDKDTHLEKYPQLQFCTIFGSVDENGEEDGTGDDALDRLRKRYDARDENTKHGIEKDCYTRATRYNPGQKVDDGSEPDLLGDEVDWKYVEKDDNVMYNDWFSMYDQMLDLKKGGYRMSTHGGAMSASIDNITYSLKQLVTKPFSVIEAKSKATSNSTDLYLYKGQTDVGLNAKLSAYFPDGKTSWSGFKDNTNSGGWHITDRNGNDIAESNEYNEQTTDNITLAQIDDGSYVIDCKNGTKDGTTVYLQYKFTDGYYSYYDKKTGEDTPITIENYKADKGKLPMIKVHCYAKKSQADSAAWAASLQGSIFAGDGAGGWIAVAVVVVLVLAGGIFVLYRKRKKA